MRTIAISDPHGCYDEFNLLLEKIEYNPTSDKLILLGDYIDRGTKSKQMVERVKALHEEWGVIVLRGNHDQMFLDSMLQDNEEADALHLHNGGLQTIESYVGYGWFEHGFSFERYWEAKEFIRKGYKSHIEFMERLPYIHEDKEHIFVHAGINPFAGGLAEQTPDDFLWVRELFLFSPTCLEKKVVFGHTPTVRIHEREGVWFGKDKIGIDGGCVFGGQLNALVIEDCSYKTFHVKKGERKAG